MKLGILPAEYTAERHDDFIARLDEHVDGPAIVIGIKSGLMLFDVTVDDEIIGIVIANIDRLFNDEKQLVIMHAVANKDSKISFVEAICPFFEMLARRYDIPNIRIHVGKKGIGRMVDKLGYKMTEKVYEKRLTHGKG